MKANHGASRIISTALIVSLTVVNFSTFAHADDWSSDQQGAGRDASQEITPLPIPAPSPLPKVRPQALQPMGGAIPVADDRTPTSALPSQQISAPDPVIPVQAQPLPPQAQAPNPPSFPQPPQPQQPPVAYVPPAPVPIYQGSTDFKNLNIDVDPGFSPYNSCGAYIQYVANEKQGFWARLFNVGDPNPFNREKVKLETARAGGGPWYKIERDAAVGGVVGIIGGFPGVLIGGVIGAIAGGVQDIIGESSDQRHQSEVDAGRDAALGAAAGGVGGALTGGVAIIPLAAAGAAVGGVIGGAKGIFVDSPEQYQQLERNRRIACIDSYESPMASQTSPDASLANSNDPAMSNAPLQSNAQQNIVSDSGSTNDFSQGRQTQVGRTAN